MNKSFLKKNMNLVVCTIVNVHKLKMFSKLNNAKSCYQSRKIRVNKVLRVVKTTSTLVQDSN